MDTKTKEIAHRALLRMRANRARQELGLAPITELPKSKPKARPITTYAEQSRGY